VFSSVATAIFSVRNADKAAHGDYGRAGVSLVQGAKAANEAAKRIVKLDDKIAKTADSATSIFKNLAKQHKALDYTGKAVKWCSNNVNPLICMSAGIKVAMSDDKLTSGTTEVGALSGMFAGEYIVKQNYDKIAKSPTVHKCLEKISETKILKPVVGYIQKNKMGGKIGAVVKGITFVAASIGSYAVGQNLSREFADKIKTNINYNKDEKIDQRA